MKTNLMLVLEAAGAAIAGGGVGVLDKSEIVDRQPTKADGEALGEVHEMWQENKSDLQAAAKSLRAFLAPSNNLDKDEQITKLRDEYVAAATKYADDFIVGRMTLAELPRGTTAVGGANIQSVLVENLDRVDSTLKSVLTPAEARVLNKASFK